MKLAILLAAFVSTLGSARAQVTRYVDVHGIPPGTGTQADPFTSIQYAVDHSGLGDTLLVEPGTYVENIVIDYHSSVHIRSTHGPDQTRLQGGIYLEFGPSVEGLTCASVTMGDFTSLRNCVMLYQPGVGDDRGIFHWGDLLVEHCTVVGFPLPIVQFAFDSGTPVFRSTIVYGNGNGYSYGNQPLVSFDGSAFWNASADDYHIAPGSVLIDSGSAMSPLDPDGSPADLGAYAYDATYAPESFTYCVGKLNGQGCVPSISASGVCSATGSQSFFVTASQVSSNKFGRLFYGSARADVPFMGGTRCVSSPIIRTPLSNSGGTGPCAGVLSYDFHARVQSGVDPALVPGRVVYAQYWYRDPLDPVGFGLGLSNAISFPIVP